MTLLERNLDFRKNAHELFPRTIFCMRREQVHISKIGFGLFFSMPDRIENSSIYVMIIVEIFAGGRHATWIFLRRVTWCFMGLTVEHIQISKVRRAWNGVTSHIRIDQKIIKCIMSHQRVRWEKFADIQSLHDTAIGGQRKMLMKISSKLL